MERLADRLSAIPGVVAVTLGGSRATGTTLEGSDWDFGLYYRGGLDPADVAALGRPGRVFAPGEWGDIVNGGAWLEAQHLLGQPERDLSALVSDVRALLRLKDGVWGP